MMYRFGPQICSNLQAATGCPFQAWSVAETLRTRRSPRLDPTG
jgi:glycogen debranching enzyme